MKPPAVAGLQAVHLVATPSKAPPTKSGVLTLERPEESIAVTLEEIGKSHRYRTNVFTMSDYLGSTESTSASLVDRVDSQVRKCWDFLSCTKPEAAWGWCHPPCKLKDAPTGKTASVATGSQTWAVGTHVLQCSAWIRQAQNSQE